MHVWDAAAEMPDSRNGDTSKLAVSAVNIDFNSS